MISPWSPQASRPCNTYRDDVPLEAMGRVSALYYGTQLGVAHSCLGSGSAHRTCREGEVDAGLVRHK